MLDAPGVLKRSHKLCSFEWAIRRYAATILTDSETDYMGEKVPFLTATMQADRKCVFFPVSFAYRSNIIALFYSNLGASHLGKAEFASDACGYL